MTPREEPLACPFCGSKPDTNYGVNEGSTVTCRNPDCAMQWLRIEAAAWNRRAPAPVVPPLDTGVGLIVCSVCLRPFATREGMVQHGCPVDMRGQRLAAPVVPPPETEPWYPDDIDVSQVQMRAVRYEGGRGLSREAVAAVLLAAVDYGVPLRAAPVVPPLAAQDRADLELFVGEAETNGWKYDYEFQRTGEPFRSLSQIIKRLLAAAPVVPREGEMVKVCCGDTVSGACQGECAEWVPKEATAEPDAWMDKSGTSAWTRAHGIHLVSTDVPLYRHPAPSAAVQEALNALAAAGCSDGYCHLRGRAEGMHTNGGCKCLDRPTISVRAPLIRLLRSLRAHLAAPSAAGVSEAMVGWLASRFADDASEETMISAEAKFVDGEWKRRVSIAQGLGDTLGHSTWHPMDPRGTLAPEWAEMIGEAVAAALRSSATQEGAK